jgi:DNA adenine methylase
MTKPNSPLRYPGGKTILTKFLAGVVRLNSIRDAMYVEPYAGGAGAALGLLYAEYAERIILNDADPCIFSFWYCVLKQKDSLIRLIEKTPITLNEWRRQREIYMSRRRRSRIELAFASFYLNRCNRSGIIVNGGPIGGMHQEGVWKLDARYNKEELISRIEKIHLYRERIEIQNMDAVEFLRVVLRQRIGLPRILVYLDPPYFLKGSRLYLNYYKHAAHRQLAAYLKRNKRLNWLLTYDNVPEIASLYRDFDQIAFQLSYTVHCRRVGTELLIHHKDLLIPNTVA